MLGSLFGLATDLIKIVATPVVIASDVARAVTEPVAEVAEEITDSIREALDIR